jgi:hypothetical protein
MEEEDTDVGALAAHVTIVFEGGTIPGYDFVHSSALVLC